MMKMSSGVVFPFVTVFAQACPSLRLGEPPLPLDASGMLRTPPAPVAGLMEPPMPPVGEPGPVVPDVAVTLEKGSRVAADSALHETAKTHANKAASFIEPPWILR